MKVSNNTIMAPIMKKISEIYNKTSSEILDKLSKKLVEQYNDIITKHDKFKTLDKKFYDIFDTLYGPFDCAIKSFIEQKISGWMKLLEEIKNGELKKALKNYDKRYLMNRLETYFKEKHDEKKAKYKGIYKEEYEEFKSNINDFLIKQINSSKDIYGKYSLFDLARDSIFEPIFKDLETDLNRNKIDTQVELQKTIIQKKVDELKDKIMSNI